jgi:hypothetical protein
VSTTFPPLEPGRHGWAELLSLVGAVRRLAFDRSLAQKGLLPRLRSPRGSRRRLSLHDTAARTHRMCGLLPRGPHLGEGCCRALRKITQAATLRRLHMSSAAR